MTHSTLPFDRLRTPLRASAGIIFVLSAPSGCGKTTLARRLLRSGLGLAHPVSYTTRKPRPGEKNGRDYHFISHGEFQRKAKDGELLERTRIYGEEYATSRDSVENALARGKDVLLSLDARGAKSVRRLYPRAAAIFILPPGLKTLKQRLKSRDKDSKEEIERRFEQASAELGHLKEYDYFVINDDIVEALKKLKAIVIAERAKVTWSTSRFLMQMDHSRAKAKF